MSRCFARSKKTLKTQIHFGNITSSLWRYFFTRGEEKQYLNTFGVTSFCFSHASAFELQVRAGFVGGVCVTVCGCSGLGGGAERKLKAEFSFSLASSMVGAVGGGGELL